MQVSEKVRNYFENDAHLKDKFSAYSNYLLPFYKEVVKEAPDLADELIDRFENIKVHLFEATENGYLGKNRRVAHNGKYQSSIKLLTNDYVNRDAEKYKRLENFYHEMLHAVIGVRLGQWNEENLIPVPWKNDFQRNVGKPCAMLGNINFDLYSETADFESYFASGIYANPIEEGVVEDWATDLALKTYPNDEYAKNTPAVDRVSYTFSTMLCGLWNSVSGNQLRKEFLTGVGDGSKASQQTEVFKDAMYELSKTLDFRAKGGEKRKAQEFDVQNICNQYKNIIKFCKDNYNKNMTEEDKDKFNEYYNSLMSGKPLIRSMRNLCDKSDEKGLQQLSDEIVKNMNKKTLFFNRGK